eukprot:1054236-Rhodomonas_salina.3
MQIPRPPQSLHLRFCRPCSHTLCDVSTKTFKSPHSSQLPFAFPCAQLPACADSCCTTRTPGTLRALCCCPSTAMGGVGCAAVGPSPTCCRFTWTSVRCQIHVRCTHNMRGREEVCGAQTFHKASKSEVLVQGPTRTASKQQNMLHEMKKPRHVKGSEQRGDTMWRMLRQASERENENGWGEKSCALQLEAQSSVGVVLAPASASVASAALTFFAARSMLAATCPRPHPQRPPFGSRAGSRGWERERSASEKECAEEPVRRRSRSSRTSGCTPHLPPTSARLRSCALRLPCALHRCNLAELLHAAVCVTEGGRRRLEYT